MTAVLGISAFYHDAAAALVVDGEIVAAAQEERFTRKKHDRSFPSNAIEFCLSHAHLDPGQIDYVGFYEKPYLTFDRLLETYLAFAPRGFRSFSKAMSVWLGEKLHIRRAIRRGVKGYRKRVVFAEHHQSHAASAYFPSPFEEAAILTVDGVGEWATATLGIGRRHKIDLLRELRFPHSLGLLYSAFTYFAGFKVNSGEYKLMGLAPFGEPIYVDLILEKLIDLKSDGSFQVDLSFFDYCAGLTMTSKRFDDLFGGPPRRPESAISQREMDMAASIQAVTEEIMLRCAHTAHRLTGVDNLCLAGGVALNCVANGRIAREGPFRRLWVQPAAGDAGGALGVALFIWHQLLDNQRTVQATDSQRGSLLGPSYSRAAVAEFLEQAGAAYSETVDEHTLHRQIAKALAGGKVVGWMQGSMEFGPRALGNRSILGDPRDPEMQSLLNRKIKFRESFRPFAPVVLEDRVDDWFDVGEGSDSPYMLVVAPLRADRRQTPTSAKAGLDRVRAARSEIPAVTHVDYSARLQTVDAERNPSLHGLLSEFARQTGCPVLINTSFNVRGEPIVRSPEDAYRCFMATDMDLLVIGSFVLQKTNQPADHVHSRQRHLEQFPLD